MLSRLKIVSKLLTERESRESYIRVKLNQLIPSQIRALRLREEWSQKHLGEEADMKQSRISAAETPGAVNFSLETLIGLAAAFKLGLWVEFVSYSELIRRENSYSQDRFKPTRLPDDRRFLEPGESDERIADFDYSHGQVVNELADMDSYMPNGDININTYSDTGEMGAAYGS